MTVNDIRFAPDSRLWLPLPTGEGRAAVGRERWIDRAALMLRMTNLENADFLAEAREKCAELWDAAQQGHNAVFFPVAEPFPMLATLFDDHGTEPHSLGLDGELGHCVSREETPIDHPFLNDARRVMTVWRDGERVVFGVEFWGEAEPGRFIGVRGITEQPQVAGQFGGLGRELFLTMSAKEPMHAS